MYILYVLYIISFCVQRALPELEAVISNVCLITNGRTDGQTDRRTDGQTDNERQRNERQLTMNDNGQRTTTDNERQRTTNDNGQQTTMNNKQ